MILKANNWWHFKFESIVNFTDTWMNRFWGLLSWVTRIRNLTSAQVCYHHYIPITIRFMSIASQTLPFNSICQQSNGSNHGNPEDLLEIHVGEMNNISTVALPIWLQIIRLSVILGNNHMKSVAWSRATFIDSGDRQSDEGREPPLPASTCL